MDVLKLGLKLKADFDSGASVDNCLAQIPTDAGKNQISFELLKDCCEELDDLWMALHREESRRLAVSCRKDILENQDQEDALFRLSLNVMLAFVDGNRYQGVDGEQIADIKKMIISEWLDVFADRKTNFRDVAIRQNDIHRSFFPRDAEETDRIIAEFVEKQP